MIRGGKSTLYQENMSAMLLEKNGRASSSSRTKHIDIKYFFIQDWIERGDIGLEYCHTENMVANFMTKPLQGKIIFEFRDRIMGMSKSENNAGGRKVRDEIAQKEDLESSQTMRGLESKQFTQTNGGFESTRSEPAGVCWKSENRFEILKDDYDLID